MTATGTTGMATEEKPIWESRVYNLGRGGVQPRLRGADGVRERTALRIARGHFAECLGSDLEAEGHALDPLGFPMGIREQVLESDGQGRYLVLGRSPLPKGSDSDWITMALPVWVCPMLATAELTDLPESYLLDHGLAFPMTMPLEVHGGLLEGGELKSELGIIKDSVGWGIPLEAWAQ